MRRRINTWIEGKRRSRQRGTPKTHEPEMPYLPNPRPYALTPQPSQQQLTVLADISPFFNLPVELRRKILIHAFGNRTVHMDLLLTHPLCEPSTNPKLISTPHPGSAPRSHYHPYTIENLGLKRDQPKYWQWRGCVCHRLPPPWMTKKQLKNDLVDYTHFYKPADDRCCDGSASMCPLWTRFRVDHTGCWIGAMGWLLTCRQAYVEGTEVLYGTNTIHLSSKPLLINLAKFIRPRSLALMTSFEIVLKIDTHVDQNRAFPNLQQLRDDLLLIQQHFPRVKRMHLGLRLDIPSVGHTMSEIQRMPTYLSDMLQLIDAFVKKLNEQPDTYRLREPFWLSFTESAYKGFKNEVQSDNQHYVRNSGTQLWRSLTPEPFEQDEKGGIINGTANNGYFICGDNQDRFIIWRRPYQHWECKGCIRCEPYHQGS